MALGSRDRLSMIYVGHCRSSEAITVRLDLGSRIPIATTAMGRAYLAALPDAERTSLLDPMAERLGERWPAVQRSIDEGIEDVRTRGFTVSVGDWQPDVNAVGAALVAADGSGVFAFNCGAPAYRISRERLEADIGPRLVAMVRNIEAVLNGSSQLARDQRRTTGGSLSGTIDRRGQDSGQKNRGQGGTPPQPKAARR